MNEADMTEKDELGCVLSSSRLRPSLAELRQFEEPAKSELSHPEMGDFEMGGLSHSGSPAVASPSLEFETSRVPSLSRSGSSRSSPAMSAYPVLKPETPTPEAEHDVFDVKGFRDELELEQQQAAVVPSSAIYLAGFCVILIVFSGLAASTRHLFRQKPLAVAPYKRMLTPEERARLALEAPPLLICGVSTLKGTSVLEDLCSHLIYTGDLDIITDGTDYTLLPSDSRDFERFLTLRSTKTSLLVSVPLGPLRRAVDTYSRWLRFGSDIARALGNSSSIQGLEIRIQPSLAIGVEELRMLHVACMEMKSSNPDLLFVLRLRYTVILRNTTLVENILNCPDIIVFRTEHHELNSKVLRAPNPYKRYLGADMAELFLFQEVEKLSSLSKANVEQEWCFSLALGGLMFKYYLGLNFGDDAITGPTSISLSKICDRFSVKRYDDSRTKSLYSLEHTSKSWVGFDDASSIARKVQAVEDSGASLCVAAYHVELDDHLQMCGEGPSPVLRTLRDLVSNYSRGHHRHKD